MKEQNGRLLADPSCGQSATDREGLAKPRHSAVMPLMSDAVLAELRAQAAPGCLLCSMDDWEEDWDA
jgi:hypothetical protein